ncbi:MAG: ABC-F family ATP-binding cassette domain-containing protein, partial [Candidatus Hydrogenedentota bacterium]
VLGHLNFARSCRKMGVGSQRGAKARTTKQKARIQRLDAMQEEGPPPRHREFEFEIPQPERLMKTVLNARDIRHGYEDTRLIDGFSVIMQKGMRVGILGPNGCGKTTLLRILMGREEPDRGRIVIGDATQFLYVDQSHEEVTPGQTVLDFVSGGQRHWDVGQKRIYVPAYLERFLFDKASVQMPMSNLSGGERNRLDLARKLLRGGNFLVLDEPTNDLDLYTLRILEEAILDFDGCALIVSHDRYFLNRVCTHMWVFEDAGNIVQLTGNYDDYLVYKGKQAEAEAAQRRQATETRRQEVRNVPKETVRRLTYLEKKELEGIEAQILEAEEKVAALEGGMADPAFYQRDGDHIRSVLQDLEEAKARVEALYARWEELEGKACGRPRKKNNP